jgi:hypothetical protein
MEYLASIMDAGGNVPMIGDSDDGAVVKLVPGRQVSGYRSLLAIGALLFRRGDLKAKAGKLDDKARWLFGESADSAFEHLDSARLQLPVRRAFTHGGYYILGCGLETQNEIRLIADAGPLGYQTIAAHGHADALAFTLSVGGKEFLIDPGTYAYHTQAPWRRYFRGTAAHNTVCVDGMDQSQSGGNFMWLRKANARCTFWSPSDERDVFEGWHDGYTRLPDPVVHRRRLSLEKRTRRVLIEDTLQMSGMHQIELFFHCSERCRVDLTSDGYAISQAGKSLLLRLPQSVKAAAQVYYGSIAPIRGWVSRRYDDKQPAPTIAWRAQLAGEVVLRSEVIC